MLDNLRIRLGLWLLRGTYIAQVKVEELEVSTQYVSLHNCEIGRLTLNRCEHVAAMGNRIISLEGHQDGTVLVWETPKENPC